MLGFLQGLTASATLGVLLSSWGVIPQHTSNQSIIATRNSITERFASYKAISLEIGYYEESEATVGFRWASKSAMGPLRVHPTNPRYFAESSGKAIYLTGSNNGIGILDAGGTDPPPVFDYIAYLEAMRNNNHNFWRLWRWSESTRRLSQTGRMTYYAPHPWQRTGPGTALDGKPKFDLTKLNQVYFDRLRERVIAAGDRGIYVGIMLFEGHALHFSQAPWRSAGHPFNIDNNINGINGDPNGDGYVTETHSLVSDGRGISQQVTQLQETYLRKVIDTVNDLDNVLYEVANEDGGGTTAWQYYVINFVKTYEATKPKQHPVGMTFRYNTGANSELFSSPAAWISPNRTAPAPYDYKLNPPPAGGGRVVLIDTDHIGGCLNDIRWPWKAFSRGHNTIYLDCGDVGVNVAMRAALGHTRRYALKMNLAATTPSTALCSTTYCLANPGSEYLLYAPSGGSFTVDLLAGTYSYEWFNPSTGAVAGTGMIAVNRGKQSFTPPFSGQAVLYLKK